MTALNLNVPQAAIPESVPVEEHLAGGKYREINSESRLGTVSKQTLTFQQIEEEWATDTRANGRRLWTGAVVEWRAICHCTLAWQRAFRIFRGRFRMSWVYCFTSHEVIRILGMPRLVDWPRDRVRSQCPGSGWDEIVSLLGVLLRMRDGSGLDIAVLRSSYWPVNHLLSVDLTITLRSLSSLNLDHQVKQVDFVPPITISHWTAIVHCQGCYCGMGLQIAAVLAVANKSFTLGKSDHYSTEFILLESRPSGQASRLCPTNHNQSLDSNSSLLRMLLCYGTTNSCGSRSGQ
ncbi:hypothetical protein J6590_052148 [Homalodisca vitripennis]|nr:hypothetical protein J6590_052148 [Homalodisca vitripennis]